MLPNFSIELGTMTHTIARYLVTIDAAAFLFGN